MKGPKSTQDERGGHVFDRICANCGMSRATYDDSLQPYPGANAEEQRPQLIDPDDE
jgi:hypothetical protein